MTIIVYSRGQLATDSRGLQTDRPMNNDDFFTAHDVVKLKVLAGNTIAAAICGSVPTESQWLAIQDVLLRCIVTTELISKGSIIYLSDQEVEQIKGCGRHFIVMSKRHTYYISPETKDSLTAFSKIDYNTPIAKGTGASIAYMALRLGKTAEQAAEAAINADPLCGGPVTSISQDNLIEVTDFAAPETFELVNNYIRDMDTTINLGKRT